MEKCKYLKWYRFKGGQWQSECSNTECEYYGEECVEKDRCEPSECEYKETK